MNPHVRILPCGKRLHLQHGPIDLIIGADGPRDLAFEAAQTRFETVLSELASELPDLRHPLLKTAAQPVGAIAKRMHTAAYPYCNDVFVTRMAAVAGAVADTILTAMIEATPLQRAYVNNGGDIAVHLTAGHSFTTAMADHTGTTLGQIKITESCGVATSGRHGRSHSMGIADSVTVIAQNAANADVAATLIANAVDLPNHPGIQRTRACDLDETSDLATQLVVTDCEEFSDHDKHEALAAGLKTAQTFQNQKRILGAALFFQGVGVATNTSQLSLSQRTYEYA